MGVIEMRDVCKIYGKSNNSAKALDHVSLTIQKGEISAIMGPSGSGKSTLLYIMGLLDSFNDGSYHIDGLDVKTMTKKHIAQIRNEKMGFVFQQFALISSFSSIENVSLPLFQSNIFRTAFKKVSRREIKTRSIEALKLVGLGDHLIKRPSELSGGQQQRVAIARALVNKPQIIIADEPTGALDQKTGEEILELLKEINGQGTTVIIVTHDSNIANKCGRIIRMVDGKINENICC